MFIVLHMMVLPACARVYHMHARCSRRPEQGIGSMEQKAQTVVVRHVSAGNGTEVQGPQEGQPVLSTTEPPLEATACIFNRLSVNCVGVKGEGAKLEGKL